MTIKQVISTLADKMNKNPKGIEGISTIYQFNLSGDEGGTYQIKINNSQVKVVEDRSLEPKCTFQLSDQNFLNLVDGKINPMMAFMSGQVKVKGDISQAMKLQDILAKYK